MAKRVYSKTFATLERQEMLERYGVNYIVNSSLQFVFTSIEDSKKASHIFKVMLNS